jgi:hypothetical protein
MAQKINVLGIDIAKLVFHLEALSTDCMLAELSGRKGHDHLGRSSYAAVGRLVMSCQRWNRLLIS